MKRFLLSLPILAALISCGPAPESKKKEEAAPPAAAGVEKKLRAQVYDSGFADAHDTYNGMGCARDGTIYYVLCSEKPDVGARMFAFDPASQRIDYLGDLTEASGEQDAKAISQGKSHVNFVESDGKLYFATHIGFYSIIDGMEKMGIPPPGMKPYRGGHLLAFDMASRKFEDLALVPRGEGVLTLNMDTQRKRIYGLSWPTGYFFRYDLPKRELKELGDFFRKGENGKGDTYRTICRSLAVDPTDGAVYFTNGDGDIYVYRYDADKVELFAQGEMKKDYFGWYDPTSPGHMAYNWRMVTWYEPEKAFYGVHGNSGYLFKFEPRAARVEVLDRITSEPSQRSGMYDQFSYGYLGFALGPDGHTLYYLTGGPIYREGKRVAGKDSTAKGESKGEENLHLITYHIPTRRYTDHGAIYFPNGDRPAYVNSIAVGKDGTVYSLSRIKRGERTVTDLFSVKP